MENSNQIKLPEAFIIYLQNLPEQGMGYQIVDIELSDGRILSDRIIFNSSYLKKLDDKEKIEPNQIKKIKIK